VLLRRLGALVCAFALSFNTLAANKNVPTPLGQQLPVEVVLNQQELGVDVSTNGAAVAGAVIGGLIGGLVSAAIANAQLKAAEERVSPLRDLLIGYDFNKELEAELRAKLPSEGISLNPAITTMPTHWAVLDPESGKQLPRQALVLIPRYSIDSKFATLRVQIHAQLIERTPKSNGKLKGKVLFNRFYGFNHQIKDGKLEDNLQQWTSLGSDGMGTLLDQSIEQVAAMIVHDFTPEGRSEWARRPAKKGAVLKGQAYPGVAVRTTDDVIWVRNGPRMMMLNGHRPLDVPAFLASMQSVPEPVQSAAVASESAVTDQPVADQLAQSATDAPRAPSTEQAAPAQPASEQPASEQPTQPQPETSAEGKP
jgi:hypothetical protein